MTKEEIEYSIKKALRCEFDISYVDRQIEIYKTCKAMKYEEQVAEMRSDIECDHNIKLD